jgi:4'-phosphopantetheinyl transferase
MLAILESVPTSALGGELEPGHVVIYLRRPSDDPEALARDERLLDDAEKARAARFHFEVDRTTYVAAHALVREALSRHGAGQPGSVRFRRGPHGRPELEDARSGLNFSLSHTRSLTACGVTRDAELGVDVEQCRERPYAELAAACLTKEELLAWQSLPEHERADRFVLIWTLKEAYVKALGLGLSMPVQSFAVRVLPEGRAVLESVAGQSVAEWHFEWRRIDDHYLSVAYRRRA